MGEKKRRVGRGLIKAIRRNTCTESQKRDRVCRCTSVKRTSVPGNTGKKRPRIQYSGWRAKFDGRRGGGGAAAGAAAIAGAGVTGGGGSGGRGMS